MINKKQLHRLWLKLVKENLIGPMKASKYEEPKAIVRLHQKNPIVSRDNMIDFYLEECDIQPFIRRFKDQIKKVEIKFELNKTWVNIYFKEHKQNAS